MTTPDALTVLKELDIRAEDAVGKAGMVDTHCLAGARLVRAEITKTIARLEREQAEELKRQTDARHGGCNCD